MDPQRVRWYMQTRSSRWYIFA